MSPHRPAAPGSAISGPYILLVFHEDLQRRAQAAENHDADQGWSTARQLGGVAHGPYIRANIDRVGDQQEHPDGHTSPLA